MKLRYKVENKDGTPYVHDFSDWRRYLPDKFTIKEVRLWRSNDPEDPEDELTFIFVPCED